MYLLLLKWYSFKKKFIRCFLDSGVSQDVKPEVTVSKREFDVCDLRECWTACDGTSLDGSKTCRLTQGVYLYYT